LSSLCGPFGSEDISLSRPLLLFRVHILSDLFQKRSASLVFLLFPRARGFFAPALCLNLLGRGVWSSDWQTPRFSPPRPSTSPFPLPSKTSEGGLRLPTFTGPVAVLPNFFLCCFSRFVSYKVGRAPPTVPVSFCHLRSFRRASLCVYPRDGFF